MFFSQLGVDFLEDFPAETAALSTPNFMKLWVCHLQRLLTKLKRRTDSWRSNITRTRILIMEINYAYEILSNPDRRRLYDARGLDGIQEGGSGGEDFDLFSNIFGGDDSPFSFFGGGHGGGGRRRRKFQDTVHPLTVNLEDVYNGKTSKLKLSKKVLCSSCKGSGGKAGHEYKCTSCSGQGIKVVKQRMGGQIQIMQVRCDVCRGAGSKVPDSDSCKTCKGEKHTQQQKIIEVHIQPGMQHNEKIVFKREGDQVDPDIDPGDVVIVLQVRDHELFERNDSDLHMKKEISLNEAICGFQFIVKHLDGRTLIIRNKPGEVVKPNSIRRVVGQGMPEHKHRELLGDLYIHFDVKFPVDHFLEEEQKYQLLRACFPAVKEVLQPPNSIEVSCMDYDEKKYSRGRGGEAYHDEDSDNEGGGHEFHGGPGGGVRCQQQ
ncbi:unnamed protein product [Caenorhabditis auriculariae]|uniref:CR-type domain-containing protein n=1 Tax=Caenorhabditis auriculariae TaxID=2777116 RepID=A0A8S1GTF9_9PELO|nr:unnamed protein product [Caenorhabditis auriculariae]